MSIWSHEMYEELAALKPTGVGFEQAWRQALVRCPRNGLRSTTQRFGDFDEVAWVRRCASDAWHGRRPGLAQVPNLLELIS